MLVNGVIDELHVIIVLIGTCSLATLKKMHQHSGVDPAESPDVTVYHSQERYLVIYCICLSVCLSVCPSVCQFSFLNLPMFNINITCTSHVVTLYCSL